MKGISGQLYVNLDLISDSTQLAWHNPTLRFTIREMAVLRKLPSPSLRVYKLLLELWSPKLIRGSGLFD